MTQRVVGIHAVRAALNSGSGIRLLVREGRLNQRQQEIVALAQACDVEVVRQNTETELVDQGVLLETNVVRFQSENQLTELLSSVESTCQFLVLDGVTDPRNFGACLRNAASFGVHGVIVAKDRSAALSEVAVKAASGAASITRVFQVTNLARCLDRLKQAGIWIVGTSLGEATRALPSLDLSGPIAVVMGAEGKGIRPKTARHCDFLAEIPMPLRDLSLNVSVATGICLYEVHRQRSLIRQSV